MSFATNPPFLAWYGKPDYILCMHTVRANPVHVSSVKARPRHSEDAKCWYMCVYVCVCVQRRHARTKSSFSFGSKPLTGRNMPVKTAKSSTTCSRVWSACEESTSQEPLPHSALEKQKRKEVVWWKVKRRWPNPGQKRKGAQVVAMHTLHLLLVKLVMVAKSNHY
jgi:hypothetical protein